MSYALVVDTETTGLSPHQHHILTIGMVMYDKSLNIVVKQQELTIKPERAFEVSRFAMQINKLNINDNFKYGITYKQVIEEFSVFCDCDYDCIVGHNINFDLKFLKEYLQDEYYRFLSPDKFKHIDTVKVLKNLKSKGNYRGENCKLQTACDYYNVELNNAHNALNDCIATAKLYGKLHPRIKVAK